MSWPAGVDQNIRRRAWRAALLALLLSGCGQKGPLYLPGTQKTPVTPNSGAAAPVNIAPEATPLQPGTALDPQPAPPSGAQKPKDQPQPQQQQQPPQTPSGSADNAPAA
jgi:predicted small lipoprotein YifL